MTGIMGTVMGVFMLVVFTIGVVAVAREGIIRHVSEPEPEPDDYEDGGVLYLLDWCDHCKQWEYTCKAKEVQ